MPQTTAEDLVAHVTERQALEQAADTLPRTLLARFDTWHQKRRHERAFAIIWALLAAAALTLLIVHDVRTGGAPLLATPGGRALLAIAVSLVAAPIPVALLDHHSSAAIEGRVRQAILNHGPEFIDDLARPTAAVDLDVFVMMIDIVNDEVQTTRRPASTSTTG